MEVVWLLMNSDACFILGLKSELEQSVVIVCCIVNVKVEWPRIGSRVMMVFLFM